MDGVYRFKNNKKHGIIKINTKDMTTDKLVEKAIEESFKKSDEWRLSAQGFKERFNYILKKNSTFILSRVRIFRICIVWGNCRAWEVYS